MDHLWKDISDSMSSMSNYGDWDNDNWYFYICSNCNTLKAEPKDLSDPRWNGREPPSIYYFNAEVLTDEPFSPSNRIIDSMLPCGEMIMKDVLE